jgi:hypothetical protein
MYGLDKNIHQDDGLCLLEHEHEQGRRGNVNSVKEAGRWLCIQHAEVEMRLFKNCSNVLRNAGV